MAGKRSGPRPAVDLRSEKRIMLLLDILCNLILFGLLSVFAEPFEDFGVKNYIILNLLFGIVVMLFMVAFEEYRPTVTRLQERLVSVILSVLYSFILFSLLNLILFRSVSLFFCHMAFWIADSVLMALANTALYKTLSNPRLFRRLRLLIIADKKGEMPRLKRMKYGTLSRYDSWYEPIDSDDPDDVERVCSGTLEDYDTVCVFDNIKDDVYDAIVTHAMHCNKDIYAVPRMVDISRGKANVVRFDDILTVYIQRYELSRVEEAAKRVMDLIIASVALILAAIPMGVIALLIRLTSPGPVFYRQERYTKDKKVFRIIKFRTMVPNAEKLTGPVFAQKDDPRITPIGRLLRSCRLDELPQIFNILSGDMSVVGPRPERPFFVEQFEKEIENYNYRFTVKAGLTSLSHVYGRYSTYIHDRTCYDLLYISNYSLLLDLKIILLTTKTMFVSDAAEGEDSFKVSANSSPVS